MVPENNYQILLLNHPMGCYDLYHTVLEIGMHKLYGYIENTMISAKNYVKLKTCHGYAISRGGRPRIRDFHRYLDHSGRQARANLRFLSSSR